MLRELTLKLLNREDLSQDEAEQALESILAPESSDAGIASFLTALSFKGETPAEVAGFAGTMRGHALTLGTDQRRLVDTAGTGGGRSSFNISTTACFVIAGAGVPVAKHGNRAVTSRSGSADMLSALGVRVELTPQEAEKCLREAGITFLFAPLFHPAMKRVARIRGELAHRTVFNLLGPLTNPAAAPYQIIGVWDAALVERVGQALALLGDCRKAWVVHSRDGLDELSSFAPGLVAEVTRNRCRLHEFDPVAYGFAAGRLDDYSGGDPARNAEICRNILAGKERGPRRDVVLINAAAALHVAGEGDFEETIEAARDSIDGGAALHKLETLVRLTGEK